MHNIDAYIPMRSPSTSSIWKTLNNDDVFKRAQFAMALHEERYILIAGGYGPEEDGVGQLRASAMFDTKMATFQELPDLPEEYNYYGRCYGGIVNGYFYIIDYYGEGARLHLSFTKTYTHNNHDDKSTISTRWEVIQPLGIKPFHAKAILSNGSKLFAFCWDGGTHQFDPQSNEWTKLPPMKRARTDFSAALVGNKIYIIGGFRSRLVEVLDISTQSWSLAPRLPKSLDSAGVIVVGSWIFVTGGIIETHHSSQSFLLDTCSQSWITSDIGLWPPRVGHSCTAIHDGSQIVCIGGRGRGHRHPRLFSMDMINRSIFHWDMIKHFVLMRALVEKGRAYPVIELDLKIEHRKDAKRSKCSASIKEINGNQRMLQALMTDLNTDMFRAVISFLM